MAEKCAGWIAMYTSLMMLTLDNGVGGHFLDEAPFLIRVEIEVESIHGRDEKK